MGEAAAKPKLGRPPDLSREKRVRIARAYAEVCAEVGPARAAILPLTVRARISKATFYKLFGSMRACRLLAIEVFLEDAVAALEGEEETGIERILESLASAPAMTELAILSGGKDAVGERLGELLREAVDEAPPQKSRSRALRAAEAAAVGAITAEVAGGRAAALPDLAPRVRELLLLSREDR